MIKRLIKTILILPAVITLIPIEASYAFIIWFFTGRSMYDERNIELFDKFINW